MDVKRIALPGAVLQIVVATATGVGLAQWWDWSIGAGLVFGLVLLFKAIEPLQRWIRAKSDLARRMERAAAADEHRPYQAERAGGAGRRWPRGRRIAHELAAQGVHFVVAEQNRELVEELRKQGVAAVAGDAGEPAVLIQAHIARASMLVVATPDTFRVRAMIETARALNPSIQTVVRTHSESVAELLRGEHAGKVFIGEHELASSMTQYVLCN